MLINKCRARLAREIRSPSQVPVRMKMILKFCLAMIAIDVLTKSKDTTIKIAQLTLAAFFHPVDFPTSLSSTREIAMLNDHFIMSAVVI